MARGNTLSAFGNLRDLSVTPGAVFLGPWANIDHEKFLIVAGVDKDRVLVCSVMINSHINQYILKRRKLLALQVELRETDYDFLSHDSYVNFAQPIKANFSHFLNDELKYCGFLKNDDLKLVQHNIIVSGVLSTEEISLFFSTC